MNHLARLSTAILVAATLAPATLADGRNPGSVLIYPIHRSGFSTPEGSGPAFFTVLTVTNTNLTPFIPGLQAGGVTNVEFDYVNIVPNKQNENLPLDCTIFDRVEFLTPADTLSVLTSLHNASGGQEGYVVVTAQDPTKFKSAWSFNNLIGSELVVTSLGGVYSLEAIPFTSPLASQAATDVDGDGELDFNGAEYEGIPDQLFLEFIALSKSSLTLINLTGGVSFVAAVKFDIFNDNEFPLSATKAFRCWFEEPLAQISPVFSDSFLSQNTPDNPFELDINGDGLGDIETGWAVIKGVNASSAVETIKDPALLGSITSGPASNFDGGRLLHESHGKQLNGDFLKFGADDPEN